MGAEPEQSEPSELVDRVESALRAFWQGDSAPMDGLLALEGSPAPELGELLADLASPIVPTAAPCLPADAIPGYRLVREVGRGGMGVVYEAVQEGTNRRVAVKVMLAGPFASPAGQARFHREIELAARLQHPGIVRVLESRPCPQGVAYYSMDYVEGVTLDRYASADHRKAREIVALGIELCRAVQYAHEHGVIHRDLKPGNILVDTQGRPQIVDFGLAKALDAAQPEARPDTLTSPHQILGTLRYLSPEQARDQPASADGRTDVYALGVTLFEALTGAMPYDTSGPHASVLHRIAHEAPVRPSSIVSRLDRDLETILLKALEKEPERRYQSAQALGEDLQRWLDGRPILARPASAFYKVRKRLRRHPQVPVLVGLALLLSIAGTWGAVWVYAQSRLAADNARRHLLFIQQDLERGVPAEARHAEAETLAGLHPDKFPETPLVLAQGRFRSEAPDMRPAALNGIKKQLTGDLAGPAARLLAEMHDASGRPDQAAELRQDAGRYEPMSAEEWYVYSFATLDLQEALRCAERAVSADPDDAFAWARIMGLSQLTGNYRRVGETLQSLRRLEPRVTDWHMCDCDWLAERGRINEAVGCYGDLLDDPVVGWNACRRQGDLYRRTGELGRAVDAYNAAEKAAVECKVTNGDVWAIYQRMVVHWMLNDPQQALQDYNRILQLRETPTCADARAYILLSDEARHEEAREVLTRARGASGSDPWLGRILDCLLSDIAPDDLIDMARKSESRKRLCEACYYAGERGRLDGDLARARECFERCVTTGVAIDPDSPPDPMNEYYLARWRLDQLAPGPANPQP